MQRLYKRVSSRFIRVGWICECELMGCAIGYPQEELSPSIRPPVDDVTRWLE